MTIALALSIVGLAAAGVVVYLMGVFVVASTGTETTRVHSVSASATAPPPPLAKPEDVAAITSMIEKALADEKIELKEWSNARWSVADAQLEQTLRRAWNMLGDWCRSDELLKRNPQVADKIRNDLQSCLLEINSKVAAPTQPADVKPIDLPA